MLFGKFISEHTPMDDYQSMLSQVEYCIENVDYNDRLPYDNRKKLDKSPVYRIVFGTMKILFIISGLALLVAIISFWISTNTNDNNTFRLLSVCSVVMSIGSFGLALLAGCVGGYMETRSEKKDRKTKYIQESKTWVLLNGYVAVADSPQGRGGQMTKRYIMDETNIVDVPFSRMDIIDRVYSIHNNKGKVTANVNAMEYYIKHPYENEYPEDNVSHYFHYYKKKMRRKIKWNEKMQGTDKLLEALNALKH